MNRTPAMGFQTPADGRFVVASRTLRRLGFPVVVAVLCLVAPGHSAHAQHPGVDRLPLLAPVFPKEDGPGRVEFQIHDELPPFGFRLAGTRDLNEVDWVLFGGQKQIVWQLEIYQPGSSEPDQVMPVGTISLPPTGTSGLSAVDFDGDGYRDLRVLDMWGATGNKLFEVFLYRPVGEQFEHSPMYSLSGQPDGTGCVYRLGTAGHAGQIRSEGYSCPREGRLEPLWAYRQDWERETGSFVFEQSRWNRGGRLVLLVKGRLGDTKLSARETVIDAVWSLAWTWDEEAAAYECVERQWNGTELKEVERVTSCALP